MDAILFILEDAFWSALAALGFALLFNVPRRALLACVLTGAVGHAFRAILITYGAFSIEGATLAAATLVGFLSKALAHHLEMPALIFAITGAIPMVPGTFAYNTMLGLLRLAGAGPGDGGPLLMEVAVSATKTALILGAIATGIAAPSLLFQRQRPVV